MNQSTLFRMHFPLSSPVSSSSSRLFISFLACLRKYPDAHTHAPHLSLTTCQALSFVLLPPNIKIDQVGFFLFSSFFSSDIFYQSASACRLASNLSHHVPSKNVSAPIVPPIKRVQSERFPSLCTVERVDT